MKGDRTAQPRRRVADVADVAQLPAAAWGLLDQVENFLQRFVAYPSEAARVAAVLWVGHAHLLDCFESTPRLAHLSPEPGSGKTRALEALELLVPRPLHAINATPAALFRSVSDDAGTPTILFDEIDTVFGPKAKDNEEVRGMLNAGHRRGATALRCVGPLQTPTEFPAYCAVALAGLGDLPDTIMSRSVVIRMRRRSPTEKVEPFRHRLHAPQGQLLHDEMERWAKTVHHQVQDAWPDMPEGIEDRPADCWEPLLAVADAAGGDWPERGRAAAVALVAQAAEGPQTLGVRLLQDIADLFTRMPVGHLATEVLLEALAEVEEAPWGDLRGKPLDARGLARRLKPYDITSKSVRVNDRVVRGYSREDLHDAWSRYLPTPPLDSLTSATSATGATFEVEDVPLWAEAEGWQA